MSYQDIIGCDLQLIGGYLLPGKYNIKRVRMACETAMLLPKQGISCSYVSEEPLFPFQFERQIFMPGGRPTIYSLEIVEKARSYVEKDFKELEHFIPSIAGLCVHLKMSRDTIYDWCKDPEKKEFSDIIDDLKEKQEHTLLAGGLGGGFNSTITKLVLGKHGYSDKTELGFDPEKPAVFKLKMGKTLGETQNDEI